MAAVACNQHWCHGLQSVTITVIFSSAQNWNQSCIRSVSNMSRLEDNKQYDCSTTIWHQKFRQLEQYWLNSINSFLQWTAMFVITEKPMLNVPDFSSTVCKTVRPMLLDHCLSRPVCNVGVLWPTGWMDEDETWHAGRPRPWPHCVRWGTSSPSTKGRQPPYFRSISVVAKWLDGSRCHLVGR